MSAHAGVLYSDGRPVGPEVIDTLSVVNAGIGSDRTGVYLAPGIALLSFATHFDQLATQERQPVQTPDGSVLTWDGRLDNREELLCRLHPELAGDYTDAHMMALAIAKWNDTILESVSGDWSLAHWNDRRHQLMLARDYSGNRPLYYCSRPDLFVWSTTEEPIIELCRLAGQVNEEYLAGIMTVGAQRHLTSHPGVFMLQPGYAVRVCPGQEPCCRRFVQFPSRTVRYQNATDYEEHYRAVLTDAVRVRLRAREPVWADLSGGYDSSAIVCLANSLVRSRLVETPALQPISVTVPDSPESDESIYIEHVERFCGLQSVRVPFVAPVELDLISESSGPCNDLRNPAVFVGQAGGHVLLSGEFGDNITVPFSVQDILRNYARKGQLAALVNESIQYGRVSRQPLIELWYSLIADAFRQPARSPAQRRSARLRVMASLRRRNSHDISGLFGIRQDFLDRALSPPVDENEDILATVPTIKREFLRSVFDTAWRIGVAAKGDPPSVRRTFPFLHRPLVDFVLAVPPTAMWSHQSHRAFVCRSLHDVLPVDILTRRNKGYSGPAVSRFLMSTVAVALENIDHLLLVQGAYADRATVADIFERFLDGSQQVAVHITRLFGAERLLRHLQSETGQTQARDHRRFTVAPNQGTNACNTANTPTI